MQKINKQSLFLGLVIGLVIGGITIGVLDAKRPKPLFSSASGDCAEEGAAAQRDLAVFESTQSSRDRDKYLRSHQAFVNCLDKLNVPLYLPPEQQ
jgi:hypothetical protein